METVIILDSIFLEMLLTAAVLYNILEIDCFPFERTFTILNSTFLKL